MTEHLRNTPHNLTRNPRLETPMSLTPTAEVYHGDCIETMNAMPPESVDAIVTDPPYGLGFMGKKWDDLPPSREWAEACFRVLKPGGHIAAFGGTRTWHRLAVAIEDAGFEMRDSLAWLYGSGFPKSHDISKGIDKLDASDERRARALEFTAFIRESGLTARRIDELTGTNMGGHFTTAASQPAVATADLFDLLRPHLGAVPERIEELVRQRTVESQNFKARAVTGVREVPRGHAFAGAAYGGDSAGREYADTRAATPDAERWQGWGTALKPAFEPIVLARKPLAERTVARNVLAHGTGAINVDATRIDGGARPLIISKSEASTGILGDGLNGSSRGGETTQGRWPANVLLDHHAAAWVDEQSGVTKSSVRPATGGPIFKSSQSFKGGGEQVDIGDRGHADQGGASRFFYSAKAPKSERPNVDGVQHPTVKPLAVMRWLLRLVTPPGGTVLDPFAGSGATIEAALIEGFSPIGIELEAEYLPLIQHRIDRQGGDES